MSTVKKVLLVVVAGRDARSSFWRRRTRRSTQRGRAGGETQPRATARRGGDRLRDGFFRGAKSAANAKRLDETSASSKATSASANSRSSERNDWRNRVEGEVASSSSGGEGGRNADDGAFQSIG